MLDICIRLAQLSDHGQLVRMREALWPNSSAQEHARELTLILEGKAVTTLPLVIFVAELVAEAAAEDWARSQGCVEVASDTWIDNEESQRVHEALGYQVVDRCVHYRKTL